MKLFGNDKLVVYTSVNCKYCTELKEKLEENKISFIEKDIIKHKKEWDEIVGLTGIPITPCFTYKGDYFVPGRDYPHADAVVSLVKNYKKSVYNESLRTLEKLKTLNYHMNMAFGRVDAILRTLENKLNKKEDEHKSTS